MLSSAHDEWCAKLVSWARARAAVRYISQHDKTRKERRIRRHVLNVKGPFRICVTYMDVIRKCHSRACMLCTSTRYKSAYVHAIAHRLKSPPSFASSLPRVNIACESIIGGLIYSAPSLSNPREKEDAMILPQHPKMTSTFRQSDANNVT